MNYGEAEKRIECVNTVSYEADRWIYTEEGYLCFGGNYDTESSYALELTDIQEYAALRVQPLDDTCRELNRKYLLPVGYGKNNMFLVDWSEEDFGELNFYDLFDKFYEAVYGQPVPYQADENLGIGAIYQIPAEEFETVIRKYISVEREELRSRTVYFPEEGTYEYKPRGFYESEYPDIPYPEVVDYTENGDGTITLAVNAVYPQESTSKAYAHRVVIRPLEDGSFQYVSNHLIFTGNDYDAWWHSERLTEEEWNEIYLPDP